MRCLNLSSLSPFLFPELNKALDTCEYNWWRVLIFLPQELKLGTTYPWLAICCWQSNTFTCTALRKLHQMSPSALRAETSSGFQSDPRRPNLTHRWQLSLTEGESDFLPVGHLFLVSSAIADLTWVLAIRASCFYISCEHLGEASQACYQSSFISRMSLFSQWYFPLSGQSTKENLWENVASSPFLCPSWLCRLLTFTHATHPNKRACWQPKGRVAEWLEHRTCNLDTLSSSPALTACWICSW